MRLYRTYHPQVLEVSLPYTLTLSDDSFQHLCKVLRLTDGEQIHVVDGSGGHYVGTLVNVAKKSAQVELHEYVVANNESPLHLHLIQGISRGDRMDLTIQKAVELGVKEITPIFTERCGVSLSGERLAKKMAHWQAIIVAACLQSYRDSIPRLNPAISIKEYFAQVKPQDKCLYVNLNPFAGQRLRNIAPEYEQINLLIGSEGGLSEQEIAQASEVGFTDFNLGPRVLRTETAGLTALAILQAQLGDL
ncbi:16S rRNA (uracil(1498)-N(3))-methyltransferase [Psittacicella melopsittaci]|uniref:Ribosomal RNA small subunit methyltransferase E n=1 Tax=Psittacicella melopsittaci TaxID=2028576 RepID=A0A3A1Y6Z7_9GAMM|nr:16S rRNA (uracil(1498)-N(3))-methyltransferase [Psittacicella melopsittaci]RIY34053.1 16S rRNA (uracil(1498)-N(3))-methyltransferase [Psittacicella melopsittaci]